MMDIFVSTLRNYSNMQNNIHIRGTAKPKLAKIWGRGNHGGPAFKAMQAPMASFLRYGVQIPIE